MRCHFAEGAREKAVWVMPGYAGAWAEIPTLLQLQFGVSRAKIRSRFGYLAAWGGG